MVLRKKLTTTIASIIVTILVAWLGTRGLDLTPSEQMDLTLGLAAIIGLITSTFNIGQGIADKGKESKNGK